MRSFRERGFAAEDIERIEAFQLGAMAIDVREHRDGGPPGADLAALIALVASSRIEMSCFVFRGLAMMAARMATPHEERSLNSWSLYPSIAMRTALAQGSASIVILRDRMDPGDAALYLDDFEHEVVRPPLRLTLGPRVADRMVLLGESIEVSMIDCKDVGVGDG